MIIGIGMDLAEVRRLRDILERHGERLLLRVLTPGERAGLPRVSAARPAYVAARFAAKEAALKALGTGLAMGMSFQDVEVHREASGQPVLVLHGAAARRAAALGVHTCHLTLTHSRDTAAAMVVLEGDPIQPVAFP